MKVERYTAQGKIIKVEKEIVDVLEMAKKIRKMAHDEGKVVTKMESKRMACNFLGVRFDSRFDKKRGKEYGFFGEALKMQKDKY